MRKPTDADLRLAPDNVQEYIAQLEKDRDAQAEAVRELVDTLRQAVASCQCRGTGKWTTSCTLCGDSTYDHYCNDEVVECDNAWCIAARAALAPVRGHN